MGKKRQTETQRLIAFGMTATEDTLNAAIESLQAVRDSRFPKTATRAPRKPRSDKGTTKHGKSNGADQESLLDA